MKEKVVFCWSGGKDSALALNRLRQDDRYEIVSLLTTCNEHFQRVSMHGVRLELLDAQAAAIGLPPEVDPSGARQTKGFWFCDLLPAAKDQSIDSFGVWPLPVREKKCYQCGTPFFCGPKKGEARCWCNEFPPLPPSTTPGADCLCPACLAQRTAGSLPGTLEGPNS